MVIAIVKVMICFVSKGTILTKFQAVQGQEINMLTTVRQHPGRPNFVSNCTGKKDTDGRMNLSK